ncbi:MAG: hypothetical protein LBF24_01405 [Puniceicoccales bacterium]|nr:hypothetical protein [Puniceicoccales bacterium]
MARGAKNGAKIPQPSLKGGRAAGELDCSYRPTAAGSLSSRLCRNAKGLERALSSALLFIGFRGSCGALCALREPEKLPDCPFRCPYHST